MSRYQLDNSWEALSHPERAAAFFLVDEMPPLPPPTGAYCPVAAWWLAELSRLIYLQEADEIGNEAPPLRRRDHLQAIGATEVRFFNRNHTRVALVRVDDETGSPAHALVFRGTHNLRNWLSNLNVLPVSWPSGGLVHKGFIDALDQVWDQVNEALDEHITPESVLFYSGHSLGGAMATLAAARRAPTALYTCGAPRVGDASFNESLKGIPFHRIVNDRDLVTRIPWPGPQLLFKHAGTRHLLTPQGQRLVDPPATPLSDRLQSAIRRLIEDASDRSLRDAPRALADHAPVNYLARLDRLRLIA